VAIFESALGCKFLINLKEEGPVPGVRLQKQPVNFSVEIRLEAETVG